MKAAHRASRQRGLTLIELLITFSVIAVLGLLAIPSFTDWIRNTRVRTVADAMQNGLRLAQAEAVRRNRSVVFSLTNAAPVRDAAGTLTATANGVNWFITTIPIAGLDLADRRDAFVQGGTFGDLASGVAIAGPAAVCFNSAGRLFTLAAAQTGVSAACELGEGATLVPYRVAQARQGNDSDRPLQVTVSIGGQVRMCDPAKELNERNPDGCPRNPT